MRFVGQGVSSVSDWGVFFGEYIYSIELLNAFVPFDRYFFLWLFCVVSVIHVCKWLVVRRGAYEMGKINSCTR